MCVPPPVCRYTASLPLAAPFHSTRLRSRRPPFAPSPKQNQTNQSIITDPDRQPARRLRRAAGRVQIRPEVQRPADRRDPRRARGRQHGRRRDLGARRAARRRRLRDPADAARAPRGGVPVQGRRLAAALLLSKDGPRPGGGCVLSAARSLSGLSAGMLLGLEARVHVCALGGL